MKKNEIVLCGGGTGGHLFPALATARVLRDKYHVPVAILSDKVGKEAGVTWCRFYLPRKNKRAQKPLFWGVLFLQSLRFFGKFLFNRPRMVVGFGGYASFPVLFAAQLLGIPMILHEQNAMLGRVNRFFVKRAKRLCLSFKKTHGLEIFLKKLGKNHGAHPIVITGNPIRFEGVFPHPRSFEEKLCIAVVGGSQGAHIFSKLVPHALSLLPETLRNNLFVIQQCRAEDLVRTKKYYEDLGISADLKTFFENMPEIYGNAHVVIARAGSSTVCEIARTGRAAIFVPYPHAADDHQFYNAQALGDSALVFRQQKITPEILARTLEELLTHEGLRENYANKITHHAHKEAAEILAKTVVECMSSG